ncbi:helicase HerA-like domain-containing protein, partial [Escherichia coli]|uniref:helicase HerA-like domain-containing protein n=1 Tax=Escherichia coli TaxID=562 RepID=UPI0010CC4905
LFLLPGMANRHGLITGATGTGTTVPLPKLAESPAEIGVPVFMAHMKGVVTRLVQAGAAGEHRHVMDRTSTIRLNDRHAALSTEWGVVVREKEEGGGGGGG